MDESFVDGAICCYHLWREDLEEGHWVARAAGVGLAIAGILMLVGYAGATVKM